MSNFPISGDAVVVPSAGAVDVGWGTGVGVGFVVVAVVGVEVAVGVGVGGDGVGVGVARGGDIWIAPDTLMPVVGPEFMPPDVSRQKTKAILEPPLGNVYARDALPPDTDISPISAKSTQSVQRWIVTLELTVACRFTGTPAVAVTGVTGPMVGFAKTISGDKSPAIVERAIRFFIIIALGPCRR